MDVSVESKVFGIGMESYTTGSHEFYLNYAIKIEDHIFNNKKDYGYKKFGNLDQFNQAINEYRKGRLADSENSEDNFDALKKFTILSLFV